MTVCDRLVETVGVVDGETLPRERDGDALRSVGLGDGVKLTDGRDSVAEGADSVLDKDTERVTVNDWELETLRRPATREQQCIPKAVPEQNRFCGERHTPVMTSRSSRHCSNSEDDVRLANTHRHAAEEVLTSERKGNCGPGSVQRMATVVPPTPEEQPAHWSPKQTLVTSPAAHRNCAPSDPHCQTEVPKSALVGRVRKYGTEEQETPHISPDEALLLEQHRGGVAGDIDADDAFLVEQIPMTPLAGTEHTDDTPSEKQNGGVVPDAVLPNPTHRRKTTTARGNKGFRAADAARHVRCGANASSVMIMTTKKKKRNTDNSPPLPSRSQRVNLKKNQQQNLTPHSTDTTQGANASLEPSKLECLTVNEERNEER